MAEDNTLPVLALEDPVVQLRARYPATRLETSKPRANRTNVAVQDTFDLIGGVPRLAVWADQNPGEFYTKIYARTLQTNQQTEHSGVIEIRSAVPRTAIDGEISEAEYVTDDRA